MKLTDVSGKKYRFQDDKFTYEVVLRDDDAVVYFSLATRPNQTMNARDLKRVRLGECLELVAALRRGEIRV